jgi:hypothetical protein
MAIHFEARYAPDVVAQVRGFYQTLSEKDRRRYAAVEARRLGHGGIEYVAGVLECSTRTIERGLSELDTGGPRLATGSGVGIASDREVAGGR